MQSSEETGFVYDADPSVAPAYRHVGRQNRPAIRLRVVHLYTGEVARAVVPPDDVDNPVVADHPRVPPAVVHLRYRAPPSVELYLYRQPALLHTDPSSPYKGELW